MFANRRPGKRSIVGTRVCAPYGDGLYAPGVIQSVSSLGSTGRQQYYAVQFDNGVTVESLTEKELIGPGFQSLGSIRLKAGQTVYITHNGREVKGHIIEPSGADSPTDELMIIDECFEQSISSQLRVMITGPSNENLEVVRRVEDVRLMESRKSARLQDQDMDYTHLADPPLVCATSTPAGGIEGKKRMVSSVIDVPTPASKHSRSGNFFAGNTVHVEQSIISDKTRAQLSKDEEAELMDEHMAALVLTSLSCSPVSPVFPFNGFINSRETSAGSSGVWSTSEASSIKGSMPSTPSPPKLLLSQSAPADVHMFSGRGGLTLAGRLHADEGLDVLEDELDDDEEDDMKISTRTVYKCTWPGCKKLYNTCPGVEQHIRSEHLGPKDDNNVLDEHEEEFYFTEVEVSLDAMMQTFDHVNTSASSPPSSAYLSASVSASGFTVPNQSATSSSCCSQQQYWPPSDHDYQRKEFRSMPLSIPAARTDSIKQSQIKQEQLGLSLPLSAQFCQQPTLSSSLPWPMTGLSGPPLSPTVDLDQGSYGQSLSTLSSGHVLSPSGSNNSHKKSRTEVKKCRKVYGLENRALWCTQCKWKKACTRFQDKMDLN